MRTIFRILITLLIVLPAVAFAQKAKVISGEHEGFTRLVVSLPPGAKWDITHVGYQIIFRVSDFSKGFDLSEIFDLIPRDRVSKATELTDGFIVELACDCRVAPFLERDRFIVLDIISPEIKSPTRFAPVVRDDDFFDTLQTVEGIGLLNTVISNSDRRPENTETQADRIMSEDLPAFVREDLSDSNKATLDELQKRIAREIGEAATRGTLIPLSRISEVQKTGVQLDLSQIAPAGESEAKVEIPTDIADGMRITSSTTPNLESQEFGLLLSGSSCEKAEELDVSTWGNTTSFEIQTGAQLRNLYGEFDNLNRHVALSYVKNLIYFGFGTEAGDLLESDLEFMKENYLIYEISRILERGSPLDKSSLASLIGCKSHIALWATLALDTSEIDRTIDPNPALLALNKLPIHLRKLVAPALSSQYFLLRDTKSASTAIRSLERLYTSPSSAARLVQGKISIKSGSTDKGITELTQVIYGNDEIAPKALIELIEAKLSSNQLIDERTAALVEAFAKEMKDDRLGPALRRAHVLALARSNNFDQAFAESTEMGGDVEDGEAVGLRLRLIEELTNSADDIVFLDHVFQHLNGDVMHQPLDAKLSTAERLLGLGFAEMSDALISNIPFDKTNSRLQNLTAQISLALQQPTRAIIALDGVVGEEANFLRAQAKQMATLHSEAAELFDKSNDLESAANAAWLSKDLETFSLTEHETYGPIVNLTTTDLLPVEIGEGMLSQSMVTLGESQSARTTLMRMLQAPELSFQ